MKKQPRFVMTPSGRITTPEQYARDVRFAEDWARYQRMERANREWQAAQRAEETAEV